MKNVGVIYNKELSSYMGSPTAYIITSVFLVLSGVSFVYYLVGTQFNDTSMNGFTNTAPYLIILFAAVLTMRMIAEEKKQGTWELLFTAPVRNIDIILGKYLACFTALVFMLVFTLYFLLMLCVFGDPDIGPVVTSYIGLLLLGSASISIGIFTSSLTSNQIVSVVLSCGILLALWFLGPIASLLPETAAKLVSAVSLSSYFSDFSRGIVDTRAVVYYISVSALFLYLSVCRIEAER